MKKEKEKKEKEKKQRWVCFGEPECENEVEICGRMCKDCTEYFTDPDSRYILQGE